MTAGTPWLLIIQCYSLILQLFGGVITSFPALESQWGSAGPVWNHHSLCKWHLTDCWLSEKLHKAAADETIHSLSLLLISWPPSANPVLCVQAVHQT